MAELRFKAKSNVLLDLVAALFTSVINFLFFCHAKPENFLAVHGHWHFWTHESLVDKAYAFIIETEEEDTTTIVESEEK